MDVEDTKAAILKAEQAVMLMDSRLQHKLRPEHKRALANAILRSGAQDDLVFHHQTVRKAPGWWTLGGLLARIRLAWETRVRGQPVRDVTERLDDWAAHIRRSGARRLLIAAMIGLICGLINFGLPAELTLQALRDKTRPINASGDIVVVAKDELSRKAFGELPWSRKYDAMLLDRLREMGAKRIVFNEVFSGPTNRVDDTAFTNSIRLAKGKVWLSGFNERSGMNRTDFLPLKIFDVNCCVAHRLIYYNGLGYVSHIPSPEIIGDRMRPSSVAILAEKGNYISDIIPDFAIKYQTIPTYSASNIISEKIKPNLLYGKSVIISETANVDSQNIKIFAQGVVPSVYVRVIAAESLKNGPVISLKWKIMFIFAFAVCVTCLFFGRSNKRSAIVILGMSTTIISTVILERFNIRFEIVPALAVFCIFGLRDRMMRRILEAQSSDPVSGLPCLSEMIMGNENKKCIAAAVKIERYASFKNQFDLKSQRDFARLIASRINILFPECVIHQGDDGIFAWTIDQKVSYDPLAHIAQLTALFRIPIGSAYGTHDVGIAVGFGSDMSVNFEARLAVAIDRARVSLFGTLTSVQ